MFFNQKTEKKKTMAKLAKPLSDKALKALKATGKNVTLYDGQGLQIVATIYGKKRGVLFIHLMEKRKQSRLEIIPIFL